MCETNQKSSLKDVQRGRGKKKKSQIERRQIKVKFPISVRHVFLTLKAILF